MFSIISNPAYFANLCKNEVGLAPTPVAQLFTKNLRIP